MYVVWKVRESSASQFIQEHMSLSKREQGIFEYAKNEYAYLVEGYRTKDGKVRQKSIAYLGSIRSPERLCERTNDILDKFPGLGKSGKLKILKSIANKSGEIAITDNRLIPTSLKL